MCNMNENGIRYGIIAAQRLHGDVVDNLMYGAQAVDLCYQEAHLDFVNKIRSEVQDEVDEGLIDACGYFEEVADRVNDYEQDFNDNYQCDEPIIEGTFDGVKYRTTWLGGALMIWVFESPITGKFALCSPCVPNCCDLDHPWINGYEGYDVPADWRNQDEIE